MAAERHTCLPGFWIPKHASGCRPDHRLLPHLPTPQVVVQSIPDARGVVAVTTHPGAVADALTGEFPGLSLESLLPGSLVNARVRRVQGDGLLVTFLTFFHGARRLQACTE